MNAFRLDYEAMTNPTRLDILDWSSLLGVLIHSAFAFGPRLLEHTPGAPI